MVTSINETDILKEKIKTTTVGLESKIEQIRTQFDSVIKGSFNATVISDAAGTGKSTLAFEAAKSLTSFNTTFVVGKFKQHGEKPYCALIEIVDNIIKHLLTLPNEELNMAKKQLLNVIGADIGFIVTISPYAKKIFGENKSIDISDYTKLKYRFQKALTKFIYEISDILFPLVIFVDDIQWADALSVELFKYIFEKGNKPNLYLLMASRNNTNLYNQHIKQFIELNNINHIQTGHMTLSLIEDLIHKIFDGNILNLNDFSNIIYKLTFGNPFYVKQLLNLILDNDIIKQNKITNEWEITEDKITSLDMPSGVKQIINLRFNSLESKFKKTLKICCCMEGQFNIKLICKITDLNADTIYNHLDVLCDKGFIIKTSENNYNLVHDIVYQIIYDKILKDEKQKIHYELGLKALETKEKDNLIFAALHLIKSNIADNSVFNYDSITRLYNAGIKSIESAAIEQALKIFTFCQSILPDNSWDDYYEITLKIKLEIAQCKFICGEYESSLKTLEYLKLKAKSKKDIANIQYKSLLLYIYLGKYKNVINLSIEALNNLGYKTNVKNLKLHTFSTTAKCFFWYFIKSKVINKNINLLSYDKEQLELIFVILTRLMFVAYFEDNDLLKYVLSNLSYISIKSDTCNYLAVGQTAFCFYNIMILNKPEKTKKTINKIITEISEFEDLTIKCGMYFLIGSFFTHLTLPLKYSLDYLEKSFEYGTQTIEYLYSGYVATMMRQTKFIMGESLESIKKNDYIDEKYGNKTTDETLKWATYIFKHHVLYLQDTTFKVDVSGHEDCINKLDNGTKMTYYYYKLQRLYLNNDMDKAYKLVKDTLDINERLRGYLIYSDLILFITLTRIDIHNQLSSSERITNKRHIKKYLKQFNKWTNLTDTHKTRQMIALAKYKIQFNNRKDFIELLSLAAIRAKNHKEIYLEALCNHLIAREFKDTFNSAKYYAMQAKNLYCQWGAYRIVELLNYKFSLKETDNKKVTNLNDHNNYLSETPIQQDISFYISKIENMNTDEVFIYTLKLLIEKTNSQYGAIFMEDNEHIQLQYESNDEKDVFHCSSPQDFEDIEKLPKSIIRYVSRIQEDVFISSKDKAGIFKKDLYFVKQEERAILCIPLKYSNIFAGILYLQWSSKQFFNDNILNTIKSLCLPLITKWISNSHIEYSKNDKLEPLTKREVEILKCIADGMTNKKISQQLDISYSTTITHIENVYRKLKVSNRVKAVIVATKVGLIK